ncbi:MAG: hypothetical protein HYU99_04350 [Deltaproteobacteria bacterium]|nr:hypothetical protein [Deltaproteobacteria bacterium]
MKQVGKRQFTLHTSRYLKRVEQTGEELVITDRNNPCLKVIPLRRKMVSDLRGLITTVKAKGGINSPILPALNKW